VWVVKRLMLVMYVTLFFNYSFQPWFEHDPLLIKHDAVAFSVLNSNRYTQVETDLRKAENPFVTLDGYVEVASNEQVILYLNENDLSFRVLNKATNYLWGSSFFLDYALLDEDNNPLYPDLYDEGDRGFRSQVWRNRVTISTVYRLLYKCGYQSTV
jgi:hypothetical protein